MSVRDQSIRSIRATDGVRYGSGTGIVATRSAPLADRWQTGSTHLMHNLGIVNNINLQYGYAKKVQMYNLLLHP